MTDEVKPKSFLPTLIGQNPSLVTGESQAKSNSLEALVDRNLEVFLNTLPSNYVSKVNGPFYAQQFEIIARQMAELQINAQEVFADSGFDYTRPEFLYQLMGVLVFPDAPKEGYPQIGSDLTYRDFLKKMIAILLQGSTKLSLEEGLAALTDSVVEVIEVGVQSRKISGKTIKGSQHRVEINVSKLAQTVEIDSVPVDLYRFPSEPGVLQENVKLVLKALKPAHVLYEYRNLFKDAFATPEESNSIEISSYYYDDTRRFCWGAQALSGTQGITLSDRTLFSDTSRDFSHILVGSNLTITSGDNANVYQIKKVLTVPFSTDSARAYTTGNGLSGTATVLDGVITDTNQDFSPLVEGETFTFSEGPNAGTYRVKYLLGLDGGEIGRVTAVGPYTSIRLAPSLLRLTNRMRKTATAQTYTIAVDRLGVQTPRTVTDEDVSSFFLLS